MISDALFWTHFDIWNAEALFDFDALAQHVSPKHGIQCPKILKTLQFGKIRTAAVCLKGLNQRFVIFFSNLFSGTK